MYNIFLIFYDNIVMKKGCNVYVTKLCVLRFSKNVLFALLFYCVQYFAIVEVSFFALISVCVKKQKLAMICFNMFLLNIFV